MTITLSYVFDDELGLTRQRNNGGFVDYFPDGRPVRSKAVIRRINSQGEFALPRIVAETKELGR